MWREVIQPRKVKGGPGSRNASSPWLAAPPACRPEGGRRREALRSGTASGYWVEGPVGQVFQHQDPAWSSTRSFCYMNRAATTVVLSQASENLAGLTDGRREKVQARSKALAGEVGGTARGRPQRLMPAPCSQLGWSMGVAESPNLLLSVFLHFRDMGRGGTRGVDSLGAEICPSVREGSSSLSLLSCSSAGQTRAPQIEAHLAD